ncbi:BTB/POZ domain-containing protein KCTD2 [Mizuhopecten yessoensis]|uniref:BTB/POZ domain-containing protein KCTD2 n=1 Tax=Mizuhopecten yessoensis TaxID=6573 RepID=A0A210PRH2_MIZYE|nr:BTB/POZ domain-containing protein KCTD2 [Mizuhopecten yessoensis]
MVPTSLSVGTDDLLKLQEAQETQLVLNIGGSDFRTTRSTLLKDPQSKLARMVSKDSPVRPDKGGKYFLDRDSHHFRFILNYRNNCILNPRLLPKDIRYLNEMLLEAEFYNLEGLVRIIHTRLLALYALE